MYCMKTKLNVLYENQSVFLSPSFLTIPIEESFTHVSMHKWIPLIFMVVLDLIFVFDYLWALLLLKLSNKSVWRRWAWKEVWIRPKIFGSSVQMNTCQWMLNSFAKVKIYCGQFIMENVASAKPTSSFVNFFLCPYLYNYYIFEKKKTSRSLIFISAYENWIISKYPEYYIHYSSISTLTNSMSNSMSLCLFLIDICC